MGHAGIFPRLMLWHSDIFHIGEMIAALIIEMIWHLPEKSDAPHRLPSNEEELDALRAELNREAEQGSEPDS